MIIIATVLLLMLFFPHTVFAASEYTTSYDTTYTLLTNNTAEVKHIITITNKLAHIYATSYTISIGSPNLSDINVSDETGRIESDISTTENSTTIDIPLETPAIGKDKSKIINISYKNPDILEKAGNITEINIPRLSNANEVDNYSRKLITDITFPKSVNVSPTPRIEEIGNKRIYTWKGDKNQSITMFFGEAQYYELNLKYTITNPTLKTADTEIAIPPDTEYQKIYLNSINPSPKEIKLDSDGNWLAIYTLDSQQSLEINANLVAKLSSTPIQTITYPNNYLTNLTKPTEYWDTKSSIVANLAEQLKTPNNIYDYLVTNFSYNYARVKTGAKRLGASEALSSPTLAICTEFTDAFIALSRSLDIPARAINGYAYTTNSSLRPLSLELDVLHAWPEYFDKEKNTWVKVDPTWGNTTGGIDYFNKLDYNHITFVIQGIEDNYPYPAGAYKKTAEEKSVDVGIIYEEPTEEIKTEISYLNSSKNTITIKNLSNVSLINYQETTPEGTQITIQYLPPLAEQTININTQSSLNLRKKIEIVSIMLGLIIVIITAIFLLKKKN